MAVCPVKVFSAWQLMDSLDTWRFTVMSITLPVIVPPYKVHVKVQEGEHSAEQVKLAVTPISRAAGPPMTTFVGPSVGATKTKSYSSRYREAEEVPWML